MSQRSPTPGCEPLHRTRSAEFVAKRRDKRVLYAFTGLPLPAVPASSLASLPLPAQPNTGIAGLLARLNPDQRAAACHGLDGSDGGPLLIIAGAGTGKTNTLAHRVACLVASGVDPRTILLLTFSRRAAVEMTRRVESIVAGLGEQWARVAHSALPWAGTFHGIGARLLREYAERCGMDPAFTILDREDAADLMNLVRAELRLSESGERFPLKGTCLAIYSTAVNKQSKLDRVLSADFPWCSAWEPQLRTLFARTSRPSSAKACSTTTTCCSTGRS